MTGPGRFPTSPIMAPQVCVVLLSVLVSLLVAVATPPAVADVDAEASSVLVIRNEVRGPEVWAQSVGRGPGLTFHLRAGDGEAVMLDHRDQVTIRQVSLEAPAGELLVTGRRYVTSHAEPRPAGRARLTASFPTGCSDQDGSFTVVEAVRDAGGAIASLAVDYSVVCSDGTKVEGLLRWRSSAPYALLEGTSSTLPARVHGRQIELVVTVRNAGTGPQRLGAAALRPGLAWEMGSTSVMGDGCAGRVLAVGASCQVTISTTTSEPWADTRGYVVLSAETTTGWLSVPWSQSFVAPPRTPVLAARSERGLVVVDGPYTSRDIQRSCEGAQFTTVQEAGPTATRFLDRSAPVGELCSYRAREVAGDESSAWSDVVTSGARAEPVGAEGLFTPVGPVRVADTRQGLGVPRQRLLGGRTMSVPVLDAIDVPVSQVAAVVLNVTAVESRDATFVVVHPGGSSLPATSSLNLVRGQTRANQVVVVPGPDGTVAVFLQQGEVDVVVDVQGFYSSSHGREGSTFLPMTPWRALDTRSPDQSAAAVSDTLMVPAPSWPEGVVAVDVVVTATEPQGGGHVTVWSGDGVEPPLASSVNVAGGQTVANHVVVPVVEGADGRRWFAVTRRGGPMHVIVDVTGVYQEGAPSGLRFRPISQRRLLDTRSAGGPLPAGGARTVGLEDLAVGAVGALALNVTATGSTGSGWLQVWSGPDPDTTHRPMTSSVNYGPGEDSPAASATAVTGDGTRLEVVAGGAGAHVVLDVAGYFF